MKENSFKIFQRSVVQLSKKLFGFFPNATADKSFPVEIHGSPYGGWTILKNSLNESSVVYSFGIGYDLTFDISIINQYHCQVYAFDPTPKVMEWLKTQSLPSRLYCQEWAIYDKDGELKFFTTLDSWHFNHSSENGESIEVTVKGYAIKTIMDRLNHKMVDLIKLDIEGSEYQVIDNLMSIGLKPKQLLIEFHHFFDGKKGNIKTENAIRKLQDYGYVLFAISPGFTEYSFAWKD